MKRPLVWAMLVVLAQTGALLASSSTESALEWTLPEVDLGALDPAVQRQLGDAQREVALLLEKAGESRLDGQSDGARQVLFDALTLLADLYLGYDFLAPASAVLELLAALDEDSFRSWYLLAYVYEARGQSHDAVAAITRALALAPTDAPTLLRRGRLALEVESEPRDADDLFEKAAQADPRCAAAHYGRGEAARLLADSTAADHYRRALAIEEDLAAARYALALLLRESGDIEGARRELSKVEVGGVAVAAATWQGCADPVLTSLSYRVVGAAPHLLRAAVAHFDGDSERELAELERALELAPEDAVVHKSLAAVRWHLGELDEADHHYREAVRLAPGVAAYRFDLGELERTRGNLDRATALYRQALEIAPSFALARFRLAQIDLAAERFAEAAAGFDRVLEDDPEEKRAYMPRAIALLQAGRREQAVGALGEALEIAPPVDPNERVQATEMLLLLGAVDRAVALLEGQLAAGLPATAAARAEMWLGSVALGRGQREPAIEHLERSVSLDPTLERASLWLTEARALPSLPGGP